MSIGVRNPRKGILPAPMPDCKICRGKGQTIQDGERGQRSVKCECIRRRMIHENVKQTWMYMFKRISPTPGPSPLLDLARRRAFALVTATQPVLAAHLRSCMYDYCWYDDLHWWVEVTSDKDIVEAWLHTARYLHEEIFDADVAMAPIRPDDPKSIKDLAMRAQLMIVQLGKKVAPNKETHSTLVEAIEYRIDNDLLTWVVNHPREPVGDGNLLAYSGRLMDDLQDYGFEHVVLEGTGVESADESLPTRGFYNATLASGTVKPTDVEVPRGRVPLTMSPGSVGNRQTSDVAAEDKAKERDKKKSAKKKVSKRSKGRGES